jgi:non-ribosomal peptide synthetase component F
MGQWILEKEMSEYTSFDIVLTELYGSMKDSSDTFLDELEGCQDPAELLALMNEYVMFLQHATYLMTDSMITARPTDKENIH